MCYCIFADKGMVVLSILVPNIHLLLLTCPDKWSYSFVIADNMYEGVSKYYTPRCFVTLGIVLTQDTFIT